MSSQHGEVSYIKFLSRRYLCIIRKSYKGVQNPELIKDYGPSRRVKGVHHIQCNQKHQRPRIFTRCVFWKLSTISLTVLMAEYPLLKPCCLLEKPPAFSMHRCNLDFSIFANSFPAVSSIHR